MNKNDIGHYIKERLGALGKTQEWLAEAVGVSNNAVSKWIKTGKISRANYITVGNLLGGTPPGFLYPSTTANNKPSEINAASPVRPIYKSQRDMDIEAIVQIANTIDATGIGMLLQAARQIANERPQVKTA